MKKKEEESNFEYVERILEALITELPIQGVALAVKTKVGNSVFASRGNAPHFEIPSDDDWVPCAPRGFFG